MKLRWILLGLALIAAPAQAAVTPHELFTDNMVLQADIAAPVWGTATAGTKITVELHRGKDAVQSWSAVADKEGRWLVKLPALAATKPDEGPCTLILKGDNEVTLKNVLVGEVWICSGQSNMEWPVQASANSQAAIADAKDDRLRLYTVPKTVAKEPRQDVAKAPKWLECDSKTVPGFSAVAYFFGQKLRQTRNVPVGLIHTSWGGTPAQSWTSRESLDAEPALKHYHENLEKALKNWDPEKAKTQYDEAMTKYKAAVAKAKEDNTKAPNPPRKPEAPDMGAHTPSGLYNGMIAPLIPFAIRGAIWYQGESNAGAAYEYRTLFATMIKDWRKHWNQGDFPFLFVQLAPFMKIVQEPGNSNWAELREAQLLTTTNVPNAGMAVITDVGEETDIHPKKKQPVGERLALAARALAYGEKIEFSGPVFDSMKVLGNKAVLTFKHAGGLEARGGELTGFTVAGDDGKFHNAKAEITGDDTVTVTCEAVPVPMAVRFGWANYPVVNLWNKAGLPATPFRTDNFPITTQPKK